MDDIAQRGYFALENGRLEAARADLERALAGYRALGISDKWTSAVLSNLGLAYTRLGRHHDGAHVLRQALALKHRNREDSASLHTTLTNLALALQASGNQSGAEAALAEAAALPGLNAERRARIAQEHAFNAMNRGDFAGALISLHRVLEATPPSLSRERAQLLHNMGACYDHLQNYTEARRHFAEAVRLRRICAPGTIELANSLSNLAGLPDNVLPQPDRQRMLAEAETLGAAMAPGTASLAVTRAHRAEDLLEAGDPRAALRLAEQAIAAAPEANRMLASACLTAAMAHWELGDAPSAERMAEQAYEHCVRVSKHLVALQPILTVLGTIARRRNDLHLAADRFDQAIALAERHRTGSARESGLERWFGGTARAYHSRIEISYQRRRPGDARAAFRAAEAFRARTLAELMAAGGSVPAARSGTLHRLAAVLEALDDSALSPAGRAAFEAERDQLEAQGEQERLRLLAERPVEAEISYPVPCAVPEIQAVLDSNTTLALYTVTDEHVFLWTVTPTTFAFRRLRPRPTEMRAAVAEVLERCRDETSTVPPSSALASLSDWLIGPLTSVTGRLIICPDAALTYLPFEALPGIPRHCTVSYTPSATTLVHHARRQRRRPAPVREFAGFALEKSPRGSVLVGAIPEVEAAAALVGGRTVCRTGNEATVRAVQKYAPGSRYLHFAVHGAIRNDQPLFSALELADRSLYAHDLAAIDLCADLVVLSACETAVGAEHPGEGIVGLSRTLFAAGASAVLLTRWPVGDIPALTLIKTFYTALAAGQAPAHALAEAVRTVRRTDPQTFSHPREWAAFMLIDTHPGV